jgi:hypothetical protein
MISFTSSVSTFLHVKVHVLLDMLYLEHPTLQIYRLFNDITEMLLKVALYTINQPNGFSSRLFTVDDIPRDKISLKGIPLIKYH